MKSLIALLCSLVVLAPGRAQTPPTAPATKAGASAKTASDKTGKKTEAPKKVEAPRIEGIEVARGDKGFLGVQMVGGTFKLNFYDAKKVAIAPDVARAVLRWDPKYKIGQERVVLNPSGDGKSLSSPKAIRPPHQFKLFIVLLKQAGEGEDPAAETHVIDFKA